MKNILHVKYIAAICFQFYLSVSIAPQKIEGLTCKFKYEPETRWSWDWDKEVCSLIVLHPVVHWWNSPTKQESPPAWTQEAYRPPCSEYSFCCPTRVPPPGGGTWPGYPPRGVPDPGTPPRGGTWLGYPPGGYLTRVHPPWGVPDPGTPLGVPDPGPPGGVPDPGTPPSPGGVPDPGTPLPRGGTWLGYPPGGYLTRVHPPGGGGYLTRVPPLGGTWPWSPWGGTWPGYPPPPGGYLTRVPPLPWGGPGTWPGYPPKGGYPDPPPPRCGQTNKVKLLPSRRTTYAGGNNVN